MKRFCLTLLTVLLLGPGVGAYTIDLTLYNTVPLLDNSGLTPLAGTSGSGDLVQLILAGANNQPDTPSGYGVPEGDDTLLFTSHVGLGLPLTDAGLLVQSSILYSDSLIGTLAYVRFWNASAAAVSTFYGVSDLFALPDGDPTFHLAEFDFVPNGAAPHTTDVPFAGAMVPEPNNLFVIGLLILGGYSGWRWRWRVGGLGLVLGLGLVTGGQAQTFWRLEATASAPIRDADGSLLAGSNPDVGGGTAGCLVQILSAGSNGIADLPDAAGQPGGDDLLVTTTVIGKGIAPNQVESGRFAASFYPPPTVGTRLYARVFNAPTVAGATHWGQSATFIVDGATVMDVSVLGVTATTMPKGPDPLTTDSDGDGQTDYAELVANTNPLDATDRLAMKDFKAQPGTGMQLSIAGRVGRSYVLQRTTDELGATAVWEAVQTTAPLTAAQDLTLTDPNPPNTPQAFYRIRVIMP